MNVATFKFVKKLFLQILLFSNFASLILSKIKQKKFDSDVSYKRKKQSLFQIDRYFKMAVFHFYLFRCVLLQTWQYLHKQIFFCALKLYLLSIRGLFEEKFSKLHFRTSLLNTFLADLQTKRGPQLKIFVSLEFKLVEDPLSNSIKTLFTVICSLH